MSHREDNGHKEPVSHLSFSLQTLVTAEVMFLQYRMREVGLIMST